VSLPVLQHLEHDLCLARAQISSHGRVNLDLLQLLIETGVDHVLVNGIHNQILQLAHIVDLEVGQQVAVWDGLNIA
jgi:hypothetical protein